MSHARYLAVIAEALRDEVAPALNGDAAVDVLEVVLRTLAMVTVELEGAAESGSSSGQGDGVGVPQTVPPELKAAWSQVAPASPGTVVLPRLFPGGDVPGGGRYGREIALAAQYVANGQGEPSDIAALVAWEANERRGLISCADRLMSSSQSASEDDRYAKIPCDALEAYLRQSFDPAGEITAFSAVPGGRSRQTAMVTFVSAGVPMQMVCQREHPEGVNLTANVERQYRVLEVVNAAGLRVPRPILFEMDAAWIGAPFLLTERLSGRPGVSAGRDYFRPLDPNDQLAASLARQMGQLHAIAPAKFDDILPPADPDPDHWHQDIAAMRDRWRQFAPSPSIAIEATVNWLFQNIGCIQPQAAVVHTDMLLHNVLVDDDEVVGVLDWEVVQQGHPAQDLGYVYPVMCQLTDWASFMAAYRSAGGPDVDLRQVRWFALRSMLQFTWMSQQVGAQVRSGAADDVRMAETAISWGGRFIDRLATVLMQILTEEAAAAPALAD